MKSIRTTYPDRQTMLSSVIDSIAEAQRGGLRPVVLTQTQANAKLLQRKLAKAHAGFGVEVTPVEYWCKALWDVYGDGRLPVTGAWRGVTLWRLLQTHDTLLSTSGMTHLVQEAARRALPVFEEFEAGRALAATQRALVETLQHYSTLLRENGRIEPSQQYDYLAHASLDTSYAVFLWDIEPDTQDLPVQRLFESVHAQAFMDERLQPCTDAYDTELAALQKLIFKRSSDDQVLSAGGAVRFSFATGPSAAHESIACAIREAGNINPDAVVVVAASNPDELFDAVAQRLAAEGIICDVRATRSVLNTDCGRLLLELAALLDLGMDATPLSPAQKATALDAHRNGILGCWWTTAIDSEAYMRRNRLADADEVLSIIAGDATDDLHALVGLLESNDGAAAARRLRDSVRERFSANPCYLQEQLRAIDALEPFLCALRQGEALADILPLAEASSVSVARAAGEEPHVHIMSLQAAADLAPAGVDAVVVCDLTTKTYPVSSPENALDALLELVGAAPLNSQLDNMRRVFSRTLAAARSRVILQRCLKDDDFKDTYAAVMMEEVTDCYRSSLDDDDKAIDSATRLPHVLLPYCTTTDEAGATRNLDGTCAAAECTQPAPQPGVLPDEKVPQLILVRKHFEDATRAFLSPSQIESFLECPYLWFARSRLRLGLPDEDFSFAERGSFLHEVMQNFYEGLHAQGRQRVTEDTAKQDAQFMQQVFCTVADEQYRRAPEDSKSRYVPIDDWERRTRDELEPLLVDQVAQEATLFPGFHPHLLEWSYGDTAPVTYADCLIKGIIDRIDIDDGNRAIIMDYKSSISKDHRLLPNDFDGTFELPRKIQALIYAKVARDLLGLDVVGALYLNPCKHTVAGAVDPNAVDPGMLPFEKNDHIENCSIREAGFSCFSDMLDECERKVAQRLSLLQTGAIAPHPKSKDSCTYCPVSVCAERGRA